MPSSSWRSVDDGRFPGGVSGPFSGRMRTERAAPAHSETLHGRQQLDPHVSALALTGDRPAPKGPTEFPPQDPESPDLLERLR
jgi:hypothetical protein